MNIFDYYHSKPLIIASVLLFNLIPEANGQCLASYFQNGVYVIDDPVTVSSTCVIGYDVLVITGGSLSFEGTSGTPINIQFGPGILIDVSGGGAIDGEYANFEPAIPYFPLDYWGGIRIDGGSHSFLGCRFENSQKSSAIGGCHKNSSGGAIWLNDGDITLTDCEFNNCIAYSRGGAVLIKNESSALITQCVFNGNETSHNNIFEGGGALAILAGSIAIINESIFSNNFSASYGGAIYIKSDPNPNELITGLIIDQNSEFLDNSSDEDGGGIALDYAQMEISETSFIGNSATGAGGAISSYRNRGEISINDCYFEGNEANTKGGAVAFSGSQLVDPLYDINTITIEDNVFFQNYTSNTNSSGGAIYIGDYLINAPSPPSSPSILFLKGFSLVDNVLEQNNSYDGGALCIKDIEKTTSTQCIFLIKKNRFENNYSSQYGGAVYVENIDYVNDGNDPEIRFFLNWILKNRSEKNGGGLFLLEAHGFKGINNLIAENYSNGGFGGGIYASESDYLEFGSNTIVNNTIELDEGGGVYLENSSYQIFNSILYDNEPNSITDASGNYWYNCYYSDIEGVASQGQGNIDVDPEFLAPQYGDYSLNCTISPCINVGDKSYFHTNYDLDHNPRIPPSDGIIDMGAYECQTIIPRKARNLSEEKIKAYPIPGNDILFFESEEAINLIEIFSLSGQLFISEKCDGMSTSINIFSLPEGGYLTRITTTQSNYWQKIIKY